MLSRATLAVCLMATVHGKPAQSRPAQDRDPQPLPRLDWSFRNLALHSQWPSVDAGRQTFGQPPLIVQPKLIVGPVDDPYVREADRVAAAVVREAAVRGAVVRGSAARPADSTSGADLGVRIQRKCAACEDGHKCDKCKDEEENKERRDEGRIQKKSSESTGPGSVTEVASLDTSGGSRMSLSVRGRIEPVLGADLSHVRIHADRSAHDSARELRARAFTHDNHIWLGKGESAEDISLMAHESTHVLQQSGVIRRQPKDDKKQPEAPKKPTAADAPHLDVTPSKKRRALRLRCRRPR